MDKCQDGSTSPETMPTAFRKTYSKLLNYVIPAAIGGLAALYAASQTRLDIRETQATVHRYAANQDNLIAELGRQDREIRDLRQSVLYLTETLAGIKAENGLLRHQFAEQLRHPSKETRQFVPDLSGVDIDAASAARRKAMERSQ